MSLLAWGSAAWLVATVLLVFTIRRIVFLVAASWPSNPEEAAREHLPSVALLVPGRNEAQGIQQTLDALAAIDYPSNRLFIVLIDDGSNDATGRMFARWADGRRQTEVLVHDHPRGKIEALNAGVAAAPPTELIAVCDADVRPHRDWLRHLAAAFADPSVGGAAARLSPLGADCTVVSRYAAVETWVHQLVTSAAKDRLDLNPATNGASVYRRAALEPLGWFGSGFSEDDVRATVGLTRAGWRTRLVLTASAQNPVVQGWRDYWLQHIRWSQNLSAASHAAARPTARPPGLARKLEARILGWGYVDRLVFVGVLTFAASGMLPVWLPYLYLGTIAAQVVAALIKADTGRRFLPFLASTVVFYPVDVVASGAALLASLARRSHSPRRRRNYPGWNSDSP